MIYTVTRLDMSEKDMTNQLLDFYGSFFFLHNIKSYNELIENIFLQSAHQTKIKTRVNGSPEKQFFIYYKSPNELQLPSIHTDLVTTINSQNNPQAYNDIENNKELFTIGVDFIRPLSIPEAHFLKTRILTHAAMSKL